MPIEKLDDDFAGRIAEQLKRPGLRSHELELDVCARVGEVDRRQQGQLVQGQRPRDPGRHGEHQSPDASFCRVAQDLAEGSLVSRAAERHGSGNGRHGSSTERKQEEVIRELVPSRGLDCLPCGMHGSNGRCRQIGAGLLGQLAYREAPGLPDAERRGDGERAVHEVRIGRDKLDRDPILGQRPERKRRFEARYSGSGYEHVCRHVDLVNHRGRYTS